jgi:hypothetical protein
VFVIVGVGVALVVLEPDGLVRDGECERAVRASAVFSAVVGLFQERVNHVFDRFARGLIGVIRISRLSNSIPAMFISVSREHGWVAAASKVSTLSIWPESQLPSNMTVTVSMPRVPMLRIV